MFKDPIREIYHCYGVYQPRYDDMKRELPHIHFFEGLPSKQDLEEWYIKQPSHKLLCMDDLNAGIENMAGTSKNMAGTSKTVLSIYCALVHHYNFFSILVSQNAFSPGKEYRTTSLNTHYFILFKNRRDELQIQTLGRQIFPRQLEFFME